MQNPQNPYNTPQNLYNSPPIAAPTGEINSPFAGHLPPGANNSGMGAQSVLPAELQGLNWGAFLQPLFWSLSHSTWIGLLWIIFGIVINFVLLFKGNEWAWQNRKWDSIEQFRTVQSKWTLWGLIIFVVGVVLLVALILFIASMRAMYGPNSPGAYKPSQ